MIPHAKRLLVGKTLAGPHRLILALLAALIAAMAFGSAASAAPTYETSFSLGFTPSHIAVDKATGEIYAIDEAGDAIKRYSSAGTLLGEIEGSSTTAGTFKFAAEFETQIAVDNSGTATQGRVYLVSEKSSDGFGGPAGVFAFKSSAEEENAFRWQANPGGVGADLCGVGVNALGTPYVADFSAGVWQIDPENGARVGAKALYQTTDTCQLAFDTTGASYVRRYNTNAIEKRSAAGTAAGTTDAGPAFDVAVNTGDDSVFTVHSAQINTYDSTGASTGSFGATELAGGAASGVAVNPVDRKVYVADAGNQKIHVYDLPVTKHPLTVNVTGSGTVQCKVESGPAEACAAEYEEGKVIHAIASPAAHNKVAWTGCDSQAGNECTVTMSGPKTVTATFTLIENTLTVSRAGNGTGTVTSSPAGISCGATCSAKFEEDKVVTLTAGPAAHSAFSGWSGACTGSGSCEVTMSAAKAVTASFVKLTRTLTIANAGSGSGSVTCKVGAGAAGPCAASYDEGTTITIAATAASGSSFAGFSGGGCSASPCSLTLEADTTVTATFNANPADGGGGGGGGTTPIVAAPEDKLGPCIAKANKAAQRAKKAAKKKKGKAKRRAIRAANARKAKAIKACRAQFA